MADTNSLQRYVQEKENVTPQTSPKERKEAQSSILVGAPSSSKWIHGQVVVFCVPHFLPQLKCQAWNTRVIAGLNVEPALGFQNCT